MKRLILFVLIVLIADLVPGQSPYHLNWKTDGLLMGSSFVMAGITLALNSQLVPLTLQEIEELDPQDINRFDRGATKHLSSEASRRSDYGERIPFVIGAISPFIIPVISDNSESYGNEMLTLLLIWSETNLVASTGTQMVKSWTKRTRPYAYNPDASVEEKGTIIARKSFISGHTSTSAANTFFLAKVFSDYFPDSKYKPLVWGVAAAIPAWTGIERYLAGKHFPTDIITGYAFGALCGYFIPHMHKTRKANNELSLAIYPYSSFNQNGLQAVLHF